MLEKIFLATIVLGISGIVVITIVPFESFLCPNVDAAGSEPSSLATLCATSVYFVLRKLLKKPK